MLPHVTKRPWDPWDRRSILVGVVDVQLAVLCSDWAVWYGTEYHLAGEGVDDARGGGGEEGLDPLYDVLNHLLWRGAFLPYLHVSMNGNSLL